MTPIPLGFLSFAGGGIPAHEFIEEVELVSAGSITILSLPQDYEHIVLSCTLQATTDTNLFMRLNNDSSTAYSHMEYYVLNGSSSGAYDNSATYIQMRDLVADDTTTSGFGFSEIVLFDYSKTDRQKAVFSQGGTRFDALYGGSFNGGIYSSTSAISQVEFTNTLKAGSRVSVWGVGKA